MKQRPKNLNLFTIRLPVNALVSILHRASGCLLFVMLPVLLGMVHMLRHSAASYATLTHLVHSGWMQVLGTLLVWAFLHHFFAGIRHLVMDWRGTPSLVRARFTGKSVLVLGAVGTLLWLWF